MKFNKHVDFLIALSIVIVAVVLSVVVYQRILRVNFFVWDMRFSHLLSITGTIGIAVATPMFTLLKRFRPASWPKITRFHIFGNLVFFTLIVFHFATQVARPPTNFPNLGTGLAMFVAMGLQIAFGFTQRFVSQGRLNNRLFNAKTIKFVHASLVMVFYLIILFHVLHGLRII